MGMREMTACFSGHRNIAEKDLPRLMQRLDETIESLIERGVVFYGAGGAIGFDTLASLAVLKYRKRNPAVKLILVLPCANQDERWSKTDKQTYRHLLNGADKIKYVSERPYFDGCMEARNLHLVQNSGVCVAYMKRARSGTSQTVRLAREHGLTVINLVDE